MAGDLAVGLNKQAYYTENARQMCRQTSVPVEADDCVEYRPNPISRFFKKIFHVIGRFFKRLVGIKEPILASVKEPVSSEKMVDKESTEYKLPSSSLSPRLSSHREKLKICANMKDQLSYLEKSVLPEVNENLPSALQEFNKESKIGLQCVGIAPGPRGVRLDDKGPILPSSQLLPGLIFTTLTSAPVTIVISDRELAGKTKDEIKKIIESKVSEHKSRFSTQNKIWEKSKTNIDLPVGKTRFVGICIPGEIKGQLEDDYKEIGDLFFYKYKAKVSFCMEDSVEWDKVRGTNLPKAKGGTKSEILETISEATTKAIAEKDTALVIGLTAHGTKEGKVKTEKVRKKTEDKIEGKGKTKKSEENLLDLEEIINGITAKVKNNKTLQHVHFDLESCRAHLQMNEKLEKAIKGLRACGVEVSFALSSDDDQESYAGEHNEEAAIINPRMTKTNSGTKKHYLSLAYQINPNISYFEALRWADQLSRLDSPTRQNMQGYFFTIDSKGRLIKEQFTKDDKISDELIKPNKVATA